MIPTLIPTLVDRRWTVLMPEHRATKPGWAHWERARLAYMHAVIRPGDVVWEIGAEQGNLSVLYAMWGADVVLVEPDARYWPNLREIFEANGVADRVGGSFHGFVDRVASDNAGAGVAPGWISTSTPSPWPSCADGEPVGDQEPLSVAAGDEGHRIMLDLLLEPFPPPDVVSVDIDGAEYQMLLGAERMLAEVRPIWFISVHPEHMRDQHGDTPDDVICHMEKYGYDGEHLDFDHEHHYLFKPKPGWTP